MSGYRPKDYAGDRDYQNLNRYGFRGVLAPPTGASQQQQEAAAVAAAMAAQRARTADEYAAAAAGHHPHLGGMAGYDPTQGGPQAPVPPPYYAAARAPHHPHQQQHPHHALQGIPYGAAGHPYGGAYGDGFGGPVKQQQQQQLQQQQQQQVLQQAAAAASFSAYGGGPPAPPYGPPGTVSSYGIPGVGVGGGGPLPPYATSSAVASSSEQPQPQYNAQAAHEIAIMQEAFRNERAASLKRQYHTLGGPRTAGGMGGGGATSVGASVTPSGPSITPSISANTKSSKSPPHSASSSAFPPSPDGSSSLSAGPGAGAVSARRGGSPGDGGSRSGSEDEDDDEEDDDEDDDDDRSDDLSDDLDRPVVSKPKKKKKKDTPVMGVDDKGRPIVVDRGHTWYMGSVPLGVDDDKYWLSELQVFLRANFAEAFAASEEDIAAPMHGRNKPIVLGQVGIRCAHCKNDNPAERGQQATSYPSLISGIYNSVQQMLRLHLDCCLSMPPDVRHKIEQLKLSCSSRGGRKQYWVDSAKRVGLVDTPSGIHFARDPAGPLPPLTGPSVNSNLHRKKKQAVKEKKKSPPPPPPPKALEPEPEPEKPPLPPIDTRPLVFPEDKPLISDYLYLTLEQMAATTLMEADRVGCYKTRRVGFPGLACRHCVGQAGCGRYFPASEASLSQTTTSQTIMNHVRNCRRCPVEIRENLEIMKRNRMGPEGKRSDKPKHGGRKVFFHRLWARIQGLPVDEASLDVDESPRKRRRRAGGGSAPKRELRDGSDDAEDDSDVPDDAEVGDSGSSGQGSDTETEDEADSVDSATGGHAKAKRKGGKKKAIPWFDGCVRLTKTDDPHWLSEMECFARSDLVEVFCLTNKEDVEGYSGRKEPATGQIGIRCVFCKSLDPAERPNGCVVFPDSLSTIHTKVGDMIRLHFTSCSAMPEEARQTFKSLRGFDAKTAGDDSSQYWVDAARDIGLTNMPPGGARDGTGWGITFGRDPLQPSPADELDLEATGDEMPSLGKNSLVRADDRGLCTDQVMLLLRQVRPCLFKNGDRRAGPGSRGRDRVVGFPGLCCKHCTGKNTLGRYFPVSAKNLTDSTANSLQAHVASCTQCPEPIKASLAYLGHRSILQKAELSGSWKKSFFQKVWSRLHVDREWKVADDDDSPAYSSGDEKQSHVSKDDGSKEDGPDGGSGSENEELGDHMNVLVKAAAIWLTEQDVTTDKGGRTTKVAARSAPNTMRPTAGPTGRGGRTNGAGAPAGGNGASSAPALTSKRRRVHF